MKKKHDFSIEALQIFMSAVLITLGVLLKKNEATESIGILFLAVPGMTLLCGLFMNYLTYKHIWSYPLLVTLVFDIQLALYYYSHRSAISKMIIIVAFVSILMTTLFHLLRIELFRPGRK